MECNAKGLGVQEAFELAISAIQKCEDKMTFDVAPGILSRMKVQCCTCCPEMCCYPGFVVEKACPNQKLTRNLTLTVIGRRAQIRNSPSSRAGKSFGIRSVAGRTPHDLARA